MNKYFVFTDIHGFYDEFLNALDDAGYNPLDETHYLVGCGDYFDRGEQPKEIMDFLMKSPRTILVRGNHEDLFEKLCGFKDPSPADISNGTVATVYTLGDEFDFDDACDKAHKMVKPFFDKMVNYFETEKYIFVHGWLPMLSMGWKFCAFNPDWRDAEFDDWEQARWLNGMQMGELGYTEHGKTIVCGHWHTSWMWARAEDRSEFGDDAKFDPYFGKGYIALDACTAYSKKINILVLEDSPLIIK